MKIILLILISCFLNLSTVNSQTLSTTVQEQVLNRYDEVHTFLSDGTSFKVKRNQKFGLIDSLGNELIPPMYEQISNFYNGSNYTSAKLNGKQGIINSINQVILPFQYEMAGQVAEPLLQNKNLNRFFVVIDEISIFFDEHGMCYKSVNSINPIECKEIKINTINNDLLNLSPKRDTALFEICDNNIDDNGNGLIDCEDHFCNLSNLTSKEIESYGFMCANIEMVFDTTVLNEVQIKLKSIGQVRLKEYEEFFNKDDMLDGTSGLYSSDSFCGGIEKLLADKENHTKVHYLMKAENKLCTAFFLFSR